ncbi:O-methyltransferase 1, chloroplastic [Sesamum alatum]|uniref:O-methyltransferase 1, chloroplastic n=1 Tax=Sesamum alatum TaxID=300844 RepID=A0AAE2D1I4_9LAMI|nr:O-methyltransferase 1, chloroplastic [Sesamum alatum]
MELLLRFPQPTATPLVRPIPCLFQTSKRKRYRVFSAVEKEEDDPYFQAAMERASLRLQETLRPDPLFIDPYIRCLLPPDIQMDVDQDLHEHCLGTKFIDDKLLSTIQNNDGLRQVVLLTDGMDTRPYRLNWPASTILFDVSPDRIFRRSIKKLEEVGANIPRSCLFVHIPHETSDIQQLLRNKGFNGARPSLWVFQGLTIMTLANFKDILDAVSNLAMKGCLFIGELPSWLAETEIGVKSTRTKWMDKLFVSHGLKVKMIKYDEVARNLGKESAPADPKTILFMAEQLQFSDDQMEIWRREFQRIEEEGDEEGFEEL